jgi:hypothetical protein
MSKVIKFVSATLVSAIILTGCSKSGGVPEELQTDVDWDAIALASTTEISWREDVQPVLENRCMVCHGCFDAPCQLKLTSYEGLTRGANPEKVYNGSRIKAVQPTRLGIDAQTTDEWRAKGFHSVLADQPVDDEQAAADFMRESVLYRMMRLKQLNPQPRTGLLPDSISLGLARKQVCTAQDKIDKFERKNPLWGMPYGMPNLSDDEYRTVVGWLAQGAQPPQPLEVSGAIQEQLARWEEFLNGTSNRERLMSRYLYEHLFIGHLYFSGSNDRQFYRLVRSYTPPGESIREIATVRPFDDPGTDQFWYRLRQYPAAIVAKDHVPYELSDATLARYWQLFIEPDYTVGELPGYALPDGANPFVTFAAIPPLSRYRFMLDDARFFIQGFIKGPVCRGQVALNVIEDQFWVVFVNPDEAASEDGAEILASVADYLQMPTSTDTLKLTTAYGKYWKLQEEYLAAKARYREKNLPATEDEALRLIWDGEGTNPNAALTVFRNFDSAAVEFGLLGQMPETAWVIDYPLFERIHYLLVAGFDVYGNVGHQLNTRLFMDFLRMEGEDNFLGFLPVADRQSIRASWYQGMRSKRSKYFAEPLGWSTNESPIDYQTQDPQAELYRLIIERLGPMSGGPDFLNRCSDDSCGVLVENSAALEADSVMRQLAQIRGEQLQVVPEVAYLRVINDDAPDLHYSLIHNRSWKNITSFLENAKNAERDPSGDTLTVLRKLSGTYPNFFFAVERAELENFVTRATTVQTAADYQLVVGRYGVRRTASDFWEYADWFQSRYLVEEPIEAGILDLNRYENR